MSKPSFLLPAGLSGLIGVLGISLTGLANDAVNQGVNGTIWVANRGDHTIRGFDAATGAVVNTIAMAANSQPGDLAYAKGKLYVAEEFGTPPAIAVLDADTGILIKRFILPAGGVAVIDHRDGHRVIQRLGYPGRPHGVDRAPR